MPLPSTAAEIEMMREAFIQSLTLSTTKLHELFFNPLMRQIYNKTFLQRPHTDDMMQMLTDLGIDPPDFQPISFDGLTFRWRL